MKNPLHALAVLLVILSLGACGQSGPLYVPGNPSTIQPEPQNEQNSEEEDDDERTDSGTP